MGDRGGRGVALTPPLAATLTAIAELLENTRRAWWVIAGAAAALHGAAGSVHDVDVLLDEADARRVAARLGLPAGPGTPDARFRSSTFLRWNGAPLPVELMAGFALRTTAGWTAVEPRTRMAVEIGTATVFVPEREELRAMFLAFGRPKDLTRVALLA